LKANLIKYGHLKYTNHKPLFEEVGYPFQTFGKEIHKSPILPYSLHTEYSASILNEQTKQSLVKAGFSHLTKNLKANKANLWISKEWTLDFINFIEYVVTNMLDNKQPAIIEIHPPYIENRNYQNSLINFISNYKIFEQSMHKMFGEDIIIMIENRNQSGNFLLSKSSDYLTFKEEIQKYNLSLKLIVDIPQLYGKMIRTYPKMNKIEIIDLIFKDLIQCTEYIGGFHVCGKSHRGDFQDLFGDNKSYFLEKFKYLTDKIEHTVYVVPEIHGQIYFESIMADLEQYKIFDFI